MITRLKNIWDDLSIKLKWTTLSIGIIMLTYIAYSLNIKKALNTYQKYSHTQEKVSQYKTQTILDTTRDISIETATNKNILSAISEYSKENKVLVHEISQVALAEYENYQIETTKVQIIGAYIDIISFLHFLEYKKNINTISALSIELLENSKDNYELAGTIFLKSINYENIKK